MLSAREGGPAFKAGLKGSSRDEYGRLVLGDIITAVNGVKMKSSSDLYRILDKCQVGNGMALQGTRALNMFMHSTDLDERAAVTYTASWKVPGGLCDAVHHVHCIIGNACYVGGTFTTQILRNASSDAPAPRLLLLPLPCAVVLLCCCTRCATGR